MSRTDLFPHYSESLSLSFTKEKIELDGMIVKFDKKATLVPAELVEKQGRPQLARGMGKDKKHCTIYLVAKPELLEDLDGWVESKSGFVRSIRNYVEDIFHDIFL